MNVSGSDIAYAVDRLKIYTYYSNYEYWSDLWDT